MENEILRTTMGKRLPDTMKVGSLPQQRPNLWDFIRGYLPQDARLPQQTSAAPASYMGIRG